MVRASALGGHILVNSALADDPDVVCPPDFMAIVEIDPAVLGNKKYTCGSSISHGCRLDAELARPTVERPA